MREILWWFAGVDGPQWEGRLGLAASGVCRPPVYVDEDTRRAVCAWLLGHGEVEAGDELAAVGVEELGEERLIRLPPDFAVRVEG